MAMAMAEEVKGGNSTPEKEKEGEKAEVVSVELPAPAGWTKKFMLNEDGTPRRNEIVFVSPSGEEIKHKRQLQQYLKAHPGCPPSSEFDWGTGDTPRRSARIRERAKAVETPEDERPRKRERKSSSKKGTIEKKDNGDGADEASAGKEDVAAEEAKVLDNVEMKDGNDAEKTKDEGIAEGSSVFAEVATDHDPTNKVVNEDAGEKDAVPQSNGGLQNKTENNLGNGKATLGTDTNFSVKETEKNEDAEKPADTELLASADKIVMTEVSSGGCNDGQHLPKASPVNC